MARIAHEGVRRLMGDETCREATNHSNQNNILLFTCKEMGIILLGLARLQVSVYVDTSPPSLKSLTLTLFRDRHLASHRGQGILKNIIYHT